MNAYPDGLEYFFPHVQMGNFFIWVFDRGKWKGSRVKSCLGNAEIEGPLFIKGFPQYD